MSKSNIFILLSLGFICGVGFGSAYELNETVLFSSLACLLVLATLGLIGHNNWENKIALTALFFIFAFLGLWRANVNLETTSEFKDWIGIKQEFEGVVVEDVDIRPDKQFITIRPKGFRQNILITEMNRVEYFYGDEVWVKGNVVEAMNFGDFDYKGYLERHNIYAVMRYPKAITLRQHKGNLLKEKMFRLKSLVIRRIGEQVGEPAGSLLLGVLIGAKRGLPDNLINSFQITGTSHIIAISGYNISIIITSLGVLAYLVGRKGSFWLIGACIIVFVLIAGPSASVVRSAVMGSLLLVAMMIGRPYSIAPALCFAAGVMLLVNPRILFWDVGFQLSFAATIGIVYGGPLLEKIFEKWPNAFGLKSLFITTLSANFATLPILLMSFGVLSLIAPVANIFILPAIPVTMFFGFCSLLPFLGPGFAWLVKIPLDFIIFTVSKFSLLPFASIAFNITPVTFWSLVVLLVSVYFLLFWKVNESEKN